MDSCTSVRQLLSGYVRTHRQPDTTELQQRLQAVTPEQRYELVAGVRGRLGTAIHRAAIKGHTEPISCILGSFTAEVRYKLLKVQCVGDFTAIHLASLHGHTAAMRCMLDKVSPKHQTQLLNTRARANSTPLDMALSYNQPETAALIRQYIKTAKKKIKEEQERKQGMNNADSQRRLKRTIADLKEEVPRLRAKLEEQEVLNLQKDQKIERLQKEVLEMKTKIEQVIGKVTQVEQQTQKQQVDVQKAAEELPALQQKMEEIIVNVSQVEQKTQRQEVGAQRAVEELLVLAATTEGHVAQLQQHDAEITTLQLQGVEQKTKLKGNTEGISKNRDEILQQYSLFQKKPDQTAELPEDCCINPEQEVNRPPTPAGEEVEEEDIDRGIQVIDN